MNVDDTSESTPLRPKVVHERLLLALDEIKASRDNARLYRPVTEHDKETIALAESIRKHGILQPLVLSVDKYIISGHRRHCAAQMLGLKSVPCRIDDVLRGDGEFGSNQFLALLLEHNRQRIKSRSELLREAVVSVDPHEAHQALSDYRTKKAKIKVESIEIRESRGRREISPAKGPFLAAIQKIIADLKEFWPLNIRQIHYQLINEPPLKHAAKPDSIYRNDRASYAALVELSTRARHEGLIDYAVIDDETRLVSVWDVHTNLGNYYEKQIEAVLNDYWRDLMQSQPNHIEIVVEKNTLHGLVRPIAQEFCIALTIGRGQCSTSPLYKIARRYEASGKDKLIIIAMSDLDPDGDAIAHSLGQRLRDDFGIDEIAVIKAALTMPQVRQERLAEKFERAKTGSSNYERYVEAYFKDSPDYLRYINKEDAPPVWELEALAPRVLQRLLTDAIDSVIDKTAFNAEVASERADAAHNAHVRSIVLQTLREQI